VNVHPFIVVVAVLFGANWLGVAGAIVAIPAAASIQIAIREYLEHRRDRIVDPEAPPEGPAGPSAPPGPAVPPGPPAPSGGAA
jgi:predicted PurR-regulated permease PerM